MFKMVFLFAGCLLSLLALAQHHHHESDQKAVHGHEPNQAASPYAGMQGRRIKALSDQQISDLRAGKGMSYALPAELNGYPGPSHVLAMADTLQMTPHQRHTTRKLYEQMQSEAISLAEELIAAEAELDRLFKEKKASAVTVQQATARAAMAQGKLRASHLDYHLKMTEVLTSSQIAAYNKLRGYQ